MGLECRSMPKLLPESSEPSSAEILRIQKQCDLARDEHRIDTVDSQDRSECRSWLESVTSRDSAPRFSEIECLGLGAYGLVFAANDRQCFGRRVAVKVLRPSKANQRIPRERFEFEGKVLSSLKHPNVIEHFETGQIDGVVYHVVELADCGSLANALSDPSIDYSPRQAAWLISKVADALQEAHSIPVLHRDIKPGNILLKACDPLDSEGLGLWPLLTDFGLSKKLDHSPEEPLTNYGEILGTLAYMSPEQVQGKAMRTPSDLFSLGVILHELVYRVHPFDDRGHFQTLTNIVQNTSLKPRRTGLQVPSSLEAIIAKCLQKDSRSRYRSAGDLAEDLRRFLNGEIISIATPTPWESLKALVCNHPRLAIFLGTLIASLLTFVLVLDREWRVQRNLAQEKGKISELFLQSMLGTNSSINDSVLAGKRVSPSELLENLEQKFPVLEEAFQLAPNDLRLIRHLEVMSHYISLCYFHESTVSLKESKEQKLQKAKEFRVKSLEYIGLYNSRVAKDQKLDIPMINGLYLMAVLFEGDLTAESPGRIWTAKSISAAEDYLAEHPDDEFAQDTMLHAKYLRSYFLASRPEDLDERIRLFESVCKSTDEAYRKFPHRLEFLILQIRALSELGVLLLETGKEDESDRAFASLDALISDPKVSDREDWRVFDRLIATYPSRFRVLFSCKRYQEAIELALRWEQTIMAPQRQAYYEALHDFQLGKEVGLLKSKYFRWQAILADQPGSAEEKLAEREARAARRACGQNDQFDFQRLISEIEEYGLPTEAIQKWYVEQVQ